MNQIPNIEETHTIINSIPPEFWGFIGLGLFCFFLFGLPIALIEIFGKKHSELDQDNK